MKVGMGAIERIGQSREPVGGQCREQPAAVAKVVRGCGMRDTRFAGQLPQGQLGGAAPGHHVGGARQYRCSQIAMVIRHSTSITRILTVARYRVPSI
ncbi:Uncharacterised protein [Mycobacteroides abscessus subsp. abscessus]|nr:Uncharacterised protein [Mycobacteroides abscessus subsp. abscessus]